jgi:ribonuclease Z
VTVAAGEHRIPCLAYRFDRDRQPAFNPEAARALDVPVERWSTLQRGEPVEVASRVVMPGDVLGPARRGVAVGFATDTRPTQGIVDLMRDVDLLVAESTYGRDEDRDKAVQRGHMTLREACTLAAEAKAGQLWLTHFGGTIEHPEALADHARAIFPQATIGYPGLKHTISFPDC